MRTLLAIFLTAVFSWTAEYVLNNWAMIVPWAFIVGLLFRFKGHKAFLIGFTGIFVLWLGIALYADVRNDGILSARMAELMNLPHASLFILVAACIGGLAGGLSGWSGSLVGRLLIRRKAIG